MKKKVLLLGHLGFNVNLFDGQTNKTRNVYELLRSKRNELKSLKYFDTQKFKYSLISPFEMIFSIMRCDSLIYIPAHNNLKYLFPLIYFICKILKINLLYIVVGGWLDEYLENKKLHVYLLSNIDGIFPQTNQLCEKLKQHYLYKNVVYFPNFRMQSFIPTFEQNHDDFKIVFMARIFRLKGIDKIFELARYIEDKYKKNHTFIIDFYGPIQKDEMDYFNKGIAKFEFIAYKGILNPEDIYAKLNEYDLLVLPTRYPGEGFPGTILDAYISGIPVVVSDWKYLSEFVDHGESGFLFDQNREDEFPFYIDKLYHDRNLLLHMKKKAFEKSQSYSSEGAWNIIRNYL
jgi:glycosyltransferase involved in cell wall biosynthesis